MKNQRTVTTKELVLCALFTSLIAIGAFIQIPVPFMDYFTLQFLFVLLSGMLLGPKLGALSVTTYICIGLVGFPIFAAGGGIQYIFRPTFGYLLGFAATSYVVGFLCRNSQTTTFKRYFIIALIGMLITYLIGFTYKYFMLNLYIQETTSLWTIIFASLPLDIPGDTVLCILAALLANRLKKSLKIAI
ncbi:biotin transporter BioY [Lachnospiraceae bacterium LCP25S3_G4]